jgi:predicted XRE-type DNA-binding protein
MAKASNDVGHITRGGVNLFEELGFDKVEAADLLAESNNEIAKMITIKEKLMTELSDWISENDLKQAEAAERLHVSRPRVSDVVNKKASKFTIDSLIGMLQRIGKNVEIAIS